MNNILTIYFFNRKQNTNLMLLGILSIALLLLRVKLTQDMYLLFLIWNLVLGYIPYALSSQLKTTVPGTYKFYLLLFGWLLFIPNSFYLLTDFVHLHHLSDWQYLFDALLLTCFSIAGFYAGIASMLQIRSLLEMKYSNKTCRRILISLCYLTGYGVYLGRILRFNSWDILSNPVKLFTKIIMSIENFHVYEFTLLFGTFIVIVYGISHLLSDPKSISK